MKNLRLTDWELDLDGESDLPEGIAFSHAEEEISPDQHRELEEFLKEFQENGPALEPVPGLHRGGETQTRSVPEQ
jgi:hypothetical protein